MPSNDGQMTDLDDLAAIYGDQLDEVLDAWREAVAAEGRGILDLIDLAAEIRQQLAITRSWQSDDLCRPITRTGKPSTDRVSTHLPNPTYL